MGWVFVLAFTTNFRWTVVLSVLFTAWFGALHLIMGLVLLAVIDAALRKKTAVVDLLLAVGIWLNLTVLAWIVSTWMRTRFSSGPP